MSSTDREHRARTRAEVKYGFYLHAAFYAAVMTLLLMVNLLTSSEILWVIWPLLGWGLAVALHAVRAFLLADRNAAVDRLAERELERDRGDT